MKTINLFLVFLFLASVFTCCKDDDKDDDKDDGKVHAKDDDDECVPC